ncbi:hypothetical protein CYY_007128 [Polysphondylium violaceum]|uniref:Uncharacterized protein n=1 Tax=Polysphondylium violaceum TaxID=133409 RepID=A0A8J4PR88_9MYCE|nr:hypothetical protein CYY_007128 [Polysphondylium violaceum]
MRRNECTKCVLSLTAICISVFTAGVVLLILGFLHFRTNPSPPPYMWSLSVCSNGTKGSWVGWPVAQDSTCIASNSTSFSKQQFFHIPKNILSEGIPYEPIFYITNKVSGHVEISHRINDEIVYSKSSSFSSLEKTSFAYAGGKTVSIYRDGPLREEEGDYSTTDCQNTKTGCLYEPARSLDSYNFRTSEYVHMSDIPESGSSLVVTITLNAENIDSNIAYPEAYVEYKVSGRSPNQDIGLALMIIGAVFADLMPATLFFLLQRYYYQKKNDEDIDHEYSELFKAMQNPNQQPTQYQHYHLPKTPPSFPNIIMHHPPIPPPSPSPPSNNSPSNNSPSKHSPSDSSPPAPVGSSGDGNFKNKSD